MTFNNSEELFDPGMHVTWLVQIAAFQQHPGPTSIRDRSLKFGLSYKEWYAVYFDVLRVDKGEYTVGRGAPNEAQDRFRPIEFDGEIEGFPMLSRICGYLYDAIFEADEVEQLRRECLRVKSMTSNLLALQGVDELLRICAEAQALKLSIYLMCE